VVARKELGLSHKYLRGPCGGSGAAPPLGHTWRLDKDEPTSTFNLMRGNLVSSRLCLCVCVVCVYVCACVRVRAYICVCESAPVPI